MSPPDKANVITFVEGKTAKPPVRKPFLRKYGGTILLLVALAVAALGWSALTPSLMGDEWLYLSDYIHNGKLGCPDLSIGARPFGLCWMAMVYRLVGMSVFGYHAFGIIMNLLSALLLLATLDVLLPDWAAYNGAVAALYLVLPADMTRTWLTGNIVQGTAIFLLAAYFMARFWRDGRWWAWIAGIFAVAIALGIYEVTLGALIALSGLAFLFGRHRSWPQRLGLLTPALIAIGFGLWRWQWQRTVGYAFGHEISRATTSPQALIYRLWFGARYVMGEAWSTTVLELQPFVSGDGRIARVAGLGVVIGLVALAILIAYWLSRKTHRFGSAAARKDAGTGEILDLIIAGAVGLVIVVAGYFPIIVAISPGTGYTASRAHQLPSVGAALFICAVLFGASQWLGRSPQRTRFIALAGLTPLLIIGAIGHITVTHQLRQAWTEQKMIWHSLFAQAPNIADGTHVLILLEGYDDPGRGPRPIISGPWGLSGALQLLYGKDALSASFTTDPPSQAWDIVDNLELIERDGSVRKIPAAETLFFIFSRDEQGLVQVKEVEKNGKTLLLGPDRIIPTPTDRTEWRWLVAD